MMDLNKYIVDENATLIQAVGKIEMNHSRAAVVISGEKVVGVISEGDILRALLNGVHTHAPISPFVVYSFKYLRNRDMEEAFQLVKKYLFTLIPVLDNDFNLVDVITLSDVLHSRNVVG